MTQHPQKPGAVGLVRNPQTGGSTVKPQRRPPQQFQPPGGRQQPQLAAKGLKGGGTGRGTGGDPSVPNGFVAEHHLVQSGSGGGQGSLYSGPSGLNPLIQKRFPGQPQQKAKLVNQSQLTAAQKIVLQNRKANPSDHLPTSKLQARGATLTMPLTKPSQTSCDDVAPGKKPETFGDSSSGKGVETGMSPPPESNSAEHSGPPPPVANHKQQQQSSSDSLPNSGGGVQWQKQPSS